MIETKKYITSFDELVSLVPVHVKDILNQLKEFKENPKYHKEGNTYEHIKGVANQFINVPVEEQDIDLVLAALYHDLSKLETGKLNQKTGYMSSYGHEYASGRLVTRDATFIESLGGDVDLIRNLVTNHMRYHLLPVMKTAKVKLMESLPFFDKLKLLGEADTTAKVKI